MTDTNLKRALAEFVAPEFEGKGYDARSYGTGLELSRPEFKSRVMLLLLLGNLPRLAKLIGAKPDVVGKLICVEAVHPAPH